MACLLPGQESKNVPNCEDSGFHGTVYSAVSLFSGCGGMDRGFVGGFSFLGQDFAPLPIEIKWANEINPVACATYRQNFNHPIIEGDVLTVLDTLPERADIVIGGFPCQDVSVNGKGIGLQGKRTSLYKAMVEVVSRTQPRIFVAENVKGLLAAKHENDLKRVIDDFSSLGYKVNYSLYRAHEYGVPQSRERVFIVGTLPHMPFFTHPEIQMFEGEYISARTAMRDLESAPRSVTFSHIWSQAAFSPDQGSRKLQAERPGYTVRAECHGNSHYHYSLNRRISMREAARLQSFPDDFSFAGGLRDTERQIGNAVPPVLAWHVANQVVKTLGQL